MLESISSAEKGAVTGTGGDVPASFCVVVLVYNDYPHCLNAIDSVIAQTDHDFELVIIDNGSTDNTSSSIKRYASDHRVTFVRLNSNQRSDAIKTIVESTKCKYFSLLFADDTYLPTRLETARSILDNANTINYVFFNNEFRDEG